jgi:beta-1,4-mannosyl-glycoprotein beta-1,4-N-acetylglucosaminyltransferase
MKIYDCFTFNNELDLLELRLEEMSNGVDYFVIVEADHTFQGHRKTLHLKENWDKFSKWHDKIIHVIVDDMPNNGDPWHNEHHQRNSIMKGLTSAADDDFIIVGDVDEILRESTLESLRSNPRDLVGFRMPYFNFRLNYMLLKDRETYHVWSSGSKKKHLLPNPESFRNRRFALQNAPYNYDDGRTKVFEHAGWHFTYLGDSSWVRNKIQSLILKVFIIIL